MPSGAILFALAAACFVLLVIAVVVVSRGQGGDASQRSVNINHNDAPDHDNRSPPSSTSEPTQLVTVRVVNENDEALGGATVVVDAARSGITSLTEGTWTVRLAPGRHRVEASSASGAVDPAVYRAQMADVHVPEDVHASPTQTITVVLQGWSSLTPWRSIRDAVRALEINPGTQQSVNVTYSFLPAGVMTSTYPEEHSVDIVDHVDGSLSQEAFKDEIRLAFEDWKRLLELTFVGLTVNFVETHEIDSPPLFGPYSDARADVGEIRVGMSHLNEGHQVLAYAYGPNNSTNVAGDMMFNASVDWRRDADVHDGDGGDGGFSVRYVAAHELGHSLGFGHHVLPLSLMAPTAGKSITMHEKFPHGLENSMYERNAARGIFA